MFRVLLQVHDSQLTQFNAPALNPDGANWSWVGFSTAIVDTEFLKIQSEYI